MKLDYSNYSQDIVFLSEYLQIKCEIFSILTNNYSGSIQDLPILNYA